MKEAEAQTETSEVSQETKVNTEVSLETAEVERETFTREDLDAVKAEAEARIAGLNRVVSRKDRELEEAKRLQSQPVSQIPILKTLIEEMEATPTPDEYGVTKPSPKLAGLKRQVAILEQQENAARVKAYAQTEHQKLVQQITDAGLDPNSEDFYPVEDAWEMGNYAVAARRVERILAKQKPKEETTVVKGKTEEEIRTDEREKVLVKYKIQDIGTPSGSSSSFKRIEQDYADGKISIGQYKKARKEQGID